MISITNWASEYENHRSRELANPRWVAMTNRLGHDDLLDLLETGDGLAAARAALTARDHALHGQFDDTLRELAFKQTLDRKSVV